MITNMVLMLVVNRLSGKLDFDDPYIVNIVRGCYIASNIIIFLIYIYCRYLITKKNDLTIFKYDAPASPFSQEAPKSVTTTVKAYDLEQVSAAIKSAGQGIAMMAFMHLYMKYTNPLVLQTIMPLKSAFENKLVQIHLLSRSGPEFVRPFQTPSLFGDMLGKGTEEANQPAKVKAE